MKTKMLLRFISIGMLMAAAVFAYCALSCPTLGRVFYIGGIRIDAEIKRILYGCYIVIAILLLGISFFIKEKK